MSVLLAGLFGSPCRFQGSVPGKVPCRCPMQQRVTAHASSDATGQSENAACALITLLQDSQRTLDKTVTALAELGEKKDAELQKKDAELAGLRQKKDAELQKKDAELAELRQKNDEELAGLRQKNETLLGRVDNARVKNTASLIRSNAMDARGAMEDIYQDLPGKDKNRWIAEVGRNAELRECVEKALGVEVSNEDAGNYINANLYKVLSAWVHRSLTRAQLGDSDGTIRLPVLPPGDKSLLRCILTCYNFAVEQ